MRIGAQLIIWGRRVEEDLASIVKTVAEIGYEGIETSPRVLVKYGDWKKLLKDYGLSLVALHIGVGNLKEAEDALKMLSEFNGFYLTFSGAGGKTKTQEEYLESCRFLNEVGRLAKDYNVIVCYHNHDYEVVNNAWGLKIVIENTDPELVKLCVDTYWAKCGGLEPVDFIKTHLDRIAYLHLKDGTEEDIKHRKFRELGKGCIDFKKILELVSEKLDWVIVEQDRSEKDPAQSMRESREYLRQLGY